VKQHCTTVSRGYLTALRARWGPWLIPTVPLPLHYAGSISADTVTLQPCRSFVDDWVSVSEEEIADAMVAVLEFNSKMVEGAAACAVAAFFRCALVVAVEANLAPVSCVSCGLRCGSFLQTCFWRESLAAVTASDCPNQPHSHQTLRPLPNSQDLQAAGGSQRRHRVLRGERGPPNSEACAGGGATKPAVAAPPAP